MLRLVAVILALNLAIEGCLDHYEEEHCTNGRTRGRCDDIIFAANCERTCGNCCDISIPEECFKAKARGECHNPLMNRCDKMCGHCKNFWKAPFWEYGIIAQILFGDSDMPTAVFCAGVLNFYGYDLSRAWAIRDSYTWAGDVQKGAEISNVQVT